MFFLRRLLLIFILISSFSYGQVFVKPSEIMYLEVNYNDTIVAGESQIIEFKATDAYGNPSNNTGLADKIKVFSDGLILEKTDIYPSEIKEGKFSLKISGKKVGDYSLQFLLNGKPVILKVKPTNALTPTLRFKVINNKADFVIIISPDKFLPGYPYNIKISFYDKEGNPVTTKYHLNQLFTIIANGTSKEININDFPGETYQYEIVPYTITEFSIDVIDKLTNKKIASKVIQPEKQEIGKIEIEIPNDIEVGKPFKIKLKALDTKNRLIKVYDKIGKDITLKTSGTGELIPNKVRKEAFSEGIAEVDVIYTKSEAIVIQPVIEDFDEKNLKQEEKTKSITKEENKGAKEEVKPKEKAYIKLKFPLEVGSIGRVVELTKMENSLSLKAIFSKRDLDYEIKRYEKDIKIKDKTVGKLIFYEEPDHNVKIDLLLDTKKYNVNYRLSSKNSLEVEIEEQ